MKKKALVVALSFVITAAGSVAHACAAMDQSKRNENPKGAVAQQQYNQPAAIKAALPVHTSQPGADGQPQS